jgi:hypothetical protein
LAVRKYAQIRQHEKVTADVAHREPDRGTVFFSEK